MVVTPAALAQAQAWMVLAWRASMSTAGAAMATVARRATMVNCMLGGLECFGRAKE